jgi:hypothetical protein
MTDAADERTLMLRYLHGEVSEEERAAFEDRYLADDALFERLAALDDESIDDYALGRLPPAARERFEQRRLPAPGVAERVAFARSLRNAADEDAQRRAPVAIARRTLRALTAVAAALVLVVLGWMITVDRRLEGQLGQLRTQYAELGQREQALRQQVAELTSRLSQAPVIASPPHPAPAGGVALLTLVAGLTRSGGDASVLRLSPAVSAVRLRVEVEDDAHASYQAAVDTAEGAAVWRRSGLKTHAAAAGARYVILEVPPERLRAGDYVVRLSGSTGTGTSEDVGDYSFRVVRP